MQGAKQVEIMAVERFIPRGDQKAGPLAARQLLLPMLLLVWGSNPGRSSAFPTNVRETADVAKFDEGLKNKDEDLPLKPERKLEFTTDEGTWMSVDVSPDGRTIVFDLLGNLYAVPIEGGEAKRITHAGMSFNNQPRYSPDGKWVAFISDRDGAENLWVSRPDGTEPKKLTSEKQATFGTPAWMPGSEYVLVTKAGQASPPEIWVFDVLGGTGLRVPKVKNTETPGPPSFERVFGAVASSDGRYLYYAKSVSVGAFDSFPKWQIARRDRATGSEDFITKVGGGGIRPMVAPNGNSVVYGSRQDGQTGLRILELTTGEDRWLKYPVQRDDQESFFGLDLLPGFAFTPDGKEVVAAYGGKIHRINVNTGEDRQITFSAKVSLDLGPKLDFPARIDDGPTLSARLIQNPTQSPNGKRLAFSALTHVYLADLLGGKPQRLTEANQREFYPIWSPDGQWLAYVTWSAEEGGHIWKTRADGQGQPQRLTRLPAFYSELAWSPDGARIVAVRLPRERLLEGNFLSRLYNAAEEILDIVWISAEGGDVHLIAPARGTGRPHFSSDNDRIFLHSDRELISMRFDGSDRRSHVKFTGSTTNPWGDGFTSKDILISPDGKSALVQFRTQLYAIKIPTIGGETPTLVVDGSTLPTKKVTTAGADYFAWADGGATITWALGSTFFRQSLASVSFQAETKKAESPTEPKTDAKQQSPDEKSPIEEIKISVEAPRRHPKGVVVLRGANVITMRGDEIVPDADLVVTDNRIAAVGRRGTVQVPAGTRMIDVRGATIIPGLVDTHDHWNQTLRGVLDLQSWDFIANLAYGVTTGRDPQTTTNDILAYHDLVEMGEMVGPRAFSTGPGIFNWNFQSADEVLGVVSRYKDFYRTKLIKSYAVGNRQQRQWVVEASKKLGIMPTTEGACLAELDLTHAIDGFSGNEHALPIVPLFKDVVELMAKSGISYTPTLLVTCGGPFAENSFYEKYDVHDDPKVRRFIPHSWLDDQTRRRQWYHKDEYDYVQIAESAAKVAHSGGRVCVGGHGELPGLGTHWELWALQSGGLTNHEALRAATLNGAEAIGYAQDLGSIEVGKLADLIVLNKDPLKDIHDTTAIRYVMKNGELFEGETLNQIWPQQKRLARLWFSNEKR